MRIRWEIVLSCFFIALSGMAQHEVKLAEEYVRQNEHEKARDIYRKLVKDEKAPPQVQRKYVQTLRTLKAWNEAEKFLKRQMKSFPDQAVYKAEYAVVVSEQEKKDEAERTLKKLRDDIKKNPAHIHPVAQYLLENQRVDWAERFYLEARKESGNATEYAFQLAQLYKHAGDTEKMLGEYIGLAIENKENMVYVQNAMQDDMAKAEDFEKLEKLLLDRLQKHPGQSVYSELLVWFYLQQKDFHRAFLQARAIDLRMKQEGVRVMEIGTISLQNKDFKTAAEAFEYLVKEYPKSGTYAASRRYLINAREELAKGVFPINRTAIRALVGEYKTLLAELGRNTKTAEAMRNMALLYGFYLNEKDTAVALLQEAIGAARSDRKFVDKCKLDLGDIFLLKDEPWEATLVYSQVEKDEKDSPLGYDAKLRNARLHYFRGDFQLAQEHLDILKLATSREIANDAMELSILIQDNTAMDSTGKAMRDYARSELLLFQNQDEEALAILENMLVQYPGHSLADEILWKQAQIHIRRNETEKAADRLEKIITAYGYDILADDAAFTLAKLYEEKLNRKEEAKKMYEKFLVDHPGSIFVVETRKRYRALRGDEQQ